MTTVQILTIHETGSDFVKLRDEDSEVQVNFADDDAFSKEESAGFFAGLRGKPAAIPTDGSFFIAVDFWCDRLGGGLRVVPFSFAVRSIERHVAA